MEWELTILRDGGSGEGIGLYEGKTVFVPHTLAGEMVRARAVRNAKNYIEAELLDVIEKSPERTEPFCPYYQSCGGCSMQHMPYQKTLSLKGNRVVQALRRIGGLEMEGLSALGMEQPFHYRNKAVFPVINGKIGYLRGKSREIIEIEECRLLPQAFLDALRITRDWLRKSRVKSGIRSLLVRSGITPDGKTAYMAALSTEGRVLPDADSWVKRMRMEAPDFISLQHGTFTPRDGEAVGRFFHALYGGKTISSWTCGVQAALSADSFQQVNLVQAEKLYGEAVRLAGLTGGEIIVDAYCGTGVLTRLLAANAKQAYGVEWNASTIQNARNGVAGLSNIEFMEGDCGEVLPKLFETVPSPDLVILDPPRRGCAPNVIEAVLNAKPARILYISCDPSTLARDAKALSGFYAPAALQAVDMFPWTAHVECVVLMSRKNG